MAWPRFQYDQTNLPRICAEREVLITEYHIQNQLYGLASLLKEYAGLRQEEPLPWAMEHAISFENPEPYFADVASRLPIILAVTERQAEILRPHVKAKVLSIGSAYFYMRELSRRRVESTAASERRGTLVFPDKSTTFKDTDFDRERFAAELSTLPDEYQPVYVSVFWRDFQRGTHTPFEKAGLQVVSSGHPYDPQFLFRQYDLCRHFKYTCANDLSTSFCMSVLAGCKFFYWPTGKLQVVDRGKLHVYDEEPTLKLAGKQECLAASLFPPTNNETEQLKLAERFAGKSSVKPPAFFRNLGNEGRRRLLKTSPVSVNFRNGEQRDRWAGWASHGIDVDGWSSAECGLDIPAHPEFAGVRIELKLPRGALSWGRRKLTVVADGQAKVFRLRRRRLQLDVDCYKDVRRRVKLRFAGEFRVAGGRHRAFRITNISWRNRLGGLTLMRRARIRTAA